MSPRAERGDKGLVAEDLPFEAPLRELDERIAELKKAGSKADAAVAALQQQRYDLRQRIYADLSAWDRVCLARHPGRPVAADYLELMCEDYFELRGDRRFGDDHAVFGGMARIHGRRVMLVAHRKGIIAADHIERSFGMPRPEGFRKALRAMRLAERFGLPLVTLIDTPGANPSIESEDRGQAHAVAECLAAMSQLRVPIVSVVIGEGGCGGALAIGVADWIGMLENSYYCVASPEGAAAVLWDDPDQAPKAAEALHITAHALWKLGLIDEVIPEPPGGAHADKPATIGNVKQAIVTQLDALAQQPVGELVQRRYERYRSIGLETRIRNADS